MNIIDLFFPKCIEIINENKVYLYKKWEDIPDYFLFRFNVISYVRNENSIKITVEKCNEYIQPYLRVSHEDEFFSLYYYRFEIYRDNVLVFEADREEFYYWNVLEEDSYSEISDLLVFEDCFNGDKAAFLDGYLDANYIDMAPDFNSDTFDAESASEEFFKRLNCAFGEIITVKETIITEDY